MCIQIPICSPKLMFSFLLHQTVLQSWHHHERATSALSLCLPTGLFIKFQISQLIFISYFQDSLSITKYAIQHDRLLVLAIRHGKRRRYPIIDGVCKGGIFVCFSLQDFSRANALHKAHMGDKQEHAATVQVISSRRSLFFQSNCPVSNDSNSSRTYMRNETFSLRGPWFPQSWRIKHSSSSQASNGGLC